MLKNVKGLFTLCGNEIEILRIYEDYIYAVEKRNTKVTYNAGLEMETHKVDDYKIYNFSDIGIKIFFELEDIKKGCEILCREEKYRSNWGQIEKYHKFKYDDKYEEIKQYAPIKLMTQEEKASIISSYYSDEKSMVEEKEFRGLTNVELIGRIDLDTEFYRKHYENYFRNHYYDIVYLAKSIYHNIDNIHIVDWRSDIADLFYDAEKKSLSLNAYIDTKNKTRVISDKFGNKREISTLDTENNVYNYELMLKREYDYKPFKYMNLYIADDDFFVEGSTDSFLIEIITQNRSNHKLTDIIKTIQSNQNRMIREEHDKNMLVQGCAGSGKTMILLHRLSYLTYNEYLYNLSKVKIITPNNLFNLFISELSELLGLHEIKRMVIEDYYIYLIREYQKENSIEYKKNNKGKRIKSEEIKSNRKALRYIENLPNLIAKKEDSGFNESEGLYTKAKIEEINNYYLKEVSEIYKSIDLDGINEYVKRFDLQEGIKAKQSNKERMDALYLLCNHDIIFENNKKVKLLGNYIKDIEAYTDSLDRLDKSSMIINKKIGDFNVEINYCENIKEGYQEILETKIIPTELENIKNNLVNTYMEILEKDNLRIKRGERFNKQIFLYQRKIIKYNKSINESDITSYKEDSEKLKIVDKMEKNLQIAQARLLSIENEFNKDFAELKDNFIQGIKTINENGGNVKFDEGNYQECIEKVSIFIKENANKTHKMLNYDDMEFANKLFDRFVLIADNDLDEESILAEIEHIKGNRKKTKHITTNYNEFKRYIEKTIVDLSKYETLSKEKDSIGVDGVIEILKDYMFNIRYCYDLLLGIKQSIGSINKENRLIIDDLIKERAKVEAIILKPNEISKIENSKLILTKKGEFPIAVFNRFKSLKDNKNKKIDTYGLFTLLYIFYKHYGPLKENDDYLFIDEAQEYSFYEYELLKGVNGGDTVFNLFGDINQQLAFDKGITSWKDLEGLFEFNYYELNENYRNTVQITNYCNDTFDYNHLAIGIQGPEVEVIPIVELKDKVKMEKQKNIKTRIAIIYNTETDEIIKILEYIRKKYNDVEAGTVKQFKGMEFDSVFVMPDKMVKNERYISYSRALNNLYIVKSKVNKE